MSEEIRISMKEEESPMQVALNAVGNLTELSGMITKRLNTSGTNHQKTTIDLKATETEVKMLKGTLDLQETQYRAYREAAESMGIISKSESPTKEDGSRCIRFNVNQFFGQMDKISSIQICSRGMNYTFNAEVGGEVNEPKQMAMSNGKEVPVLCPADEDYPDTASECMPDDPHNTPERPTYHDKPVDYPSHSADGVDSALVDFKPDEQDGVEVGDYEQVAHDPEPLDDTPRPTKPRRKYKRGKTVKKDD